MLFVPNDLLALEIDSRLQNEQRMFIMKAASVWKETNFPFYSVHINPPRHIFSFLILSTEHIFFQVREVRSFNLLQGKILIWNKHMSS